MLAGQTAQWIMVLVFRPDTLSLALGPTERQDRGQLPHVDCDPSMPALTYTHSFKIRTEPSDSDL